MAASRPSSIGTYEGYVPKQGDKISKETSSIDPVIFFQKYVHPRRPVVLNELLPEADGKNISRLASVAHLREAAQNSIVKIEPFNTSTNSFGTGLARRSIPFPQFLDILQDESQKGKWYLTTQYDEEQDNGDGENEEPPRDPICPPPTDKLVLDFSQRPRLMGNLVLQQSNIWIGNSLDGSSSGLHHDFHDNLYILLRGHKRFVLFPPSAHEYLHLRGHVRAISSNGLLHYVPEEDDGDENENRGNGESGNFDEAGNEPRADGLHPFDAIRWRVLYWTRRVHELEVDTVSTNSKISSKKKQKAKPSLALVDARKNLEQAQMALEKIRSSGFEANDNDNDDDVDNDEDGDDRPLFPDTATDDGSVWESDAFDETEALLAGLDAITSAGGSASRPTHGTKDESEPKSKPKREPPSFSLISPATLHAYLEPSSESTSPTLADKKLKKKAKGNEKKDKKAKRDALLPLPGCPTPLVVDLHPGEMLYLPAGWMHEVTSSSGPGIPSSALDNDEELAVPMHIAFNYWFHPPDGATFDAPYVDKEIWEEIARSVEREWNGHEKLAQEEAKTTVAGKKTSKAEKNEFERETSGNRVKISVQELVKKKRKQDTTVAPLPAKVEAYMGGDGSERQKKKARRNPRTRRRHKALLQKA